MKVIIILDKEKEKCNLRVATYCRVSKPTEEIDFLEKIIILLK